MKAQAKDDFDNEEESLDGNFMNIWIFNHHPPTATNGLQQMIETTMICMKSKCFIKISDDIIDFDLVQGPCKLGLHPFKCLNTEMRFPWKD